MAKVDEEWKNVGGVTTTATATKSTGYEVDEIEAESLKYLVENSCISCDKVLPRYSVRILPPAYMQERDEHVKKGLVSRRLMCVDCYNSMRKAHRHRLRSNPLAQRSTPLVKDVVMAFLTK